jgi:lipopolysaccharide export system protein LptA
LATTLAATAIALTALAVTAAPSIGRSANAADPQDITHSKSPIDITADQADVSNTKCIAIWRGSAEAVQDTTHLRADTITIYSHPKGPSKDGQAAACGNADKIVADGHVFYATPQQNARGDHAVYVEADDQIVMTGDVVVVQGQDVARGDKMTITVSTHEARMESNITGAGKAGRVRAVFYPDKTTQPGGGAKP